MVNRDLATVRMYEVLYFVIPILMDEIPVSFLARPGPECDSRSTTNRVVGIAKADGMCSFLIGKWGV